MSRRDPTLAVLMPVHDGVEPRHLREALMSVVAQTRQPDEFIVVVDGPVSPGHDVVLAEIATLRLVVLAQSSGVAAALSAGLGACRSEYVARVDSDDINEVDRFARQLDLIRESGADVCTSSMIEFLTEPPKTLGLRRTPVTHAEFARQMRTRNPVNHPTVMFRREAVLRVGGYHQVAFLEDYDLWARVLVAGARFIGIAEPRVRFRADGMHDRRTARSIDVSERELQRRLVSYGLISVRQSRVNLLARGIYRRLPRPVLECAYRVLFRQADEGPRPLK